MYRPTTGSDGRKRRRGSSSLRLGGAAAIAVIVALLVSACSSSSTSKGASSPAAGSGSSSSAANDGGSGPTGPCGTTVPVGPSNPSGVYASLSSSLKTVYSTLPGPLNVSPWANWPGVKGPWKLGYIDIAIGTPYQQHELDEINKLYAEGKSQGLLTGDLTTNIPATQALTTPEAQINAIQQMVRQGVNLIIMNPVAGASEAAAIDAAGAANVPILFSDNIVAESKYGISVWSQNQYGADAEALKIIGKGNILEVRGIAGNENETLLYNQGVKDLEDCPNIKIAGEVYGNWNASTAKTVVSQYLVSHPQSLQGVMQDGSMMPGVIQAFQAAGRTVPTVADGECEGADLSWWLANISKGYKGAGGCFNGYQGGYTYFMAALRVLSGNGPKYNVLELPAPLVTNANVAQYATPNEPLSWDGEQVGPVTAWCDNACLDPYFNKPGAVGTFSTS